MQEKKVKTPKRQAKQSLGISSIGSKLSVIGFRGTDTRSKLNYRDSQLRELGKSKAKFNTLSMIGNVGMEEQLRKEIVQSGQALQQCLKQLGLRMVRRSQKQQLIEIDEVIKSKDEMIKKLQKDIKVIKQTDRNALEEQENVQDYRTGKSDKDKLFEMATLMKKNRENMHEQFNIFSKAYHQHQKLKLEIEELQDKQRSKEAEQGYLGNQMISFEDFKEREKEKKKREETPTQRKAQHYALQLNSSQPQTQIISKTMKDLLNRKKITKNAIKNAKVKHDSQMGQLYAKLQFLQDEDAHLNLKITQNKAQLQRYEDRFSERKQEKQRNERNPMLEYHY